LTEIHASIIVERESQKAILIGRGGKNLKEIGIYARQEIEKFIGGKIFLGLHVKVVKNWQKDTKALKKFGFIQD
jgi:GTP-binding protein Era